MAAAAPNTIELSPASVGQRIGAYLIDVAIVIPIAMINLLPIVGQMLWGLFGGCYWLFRDVTGNSLGKMALGLVVASKTGGPSTTGQRILRNVPLCIGVFLFLIPLLGVVVAPFIALPIGIIEIIMLLATGERVGDKIANTVVLRKR